MIQKVHAIVRREADAISAQCTKSWRAADVRRLSPAKDPHTETLSYAANRCH